MKKTEADTSNENRFYLTDKIKVDGYNPHSQMSPNIDGGKFVIQPPAYVNLDNGMKKLVAPLTINGIEADYLTDLTFTQVHQLAIAGVIKLNKVQAKKYSEERKKLYINDSD